MSIYNIDTQIMLKENRIRLLAQKGEANVHQVNKVKRELKKLQAIKAAQT